MGFIIRVARQPSYQRLVTYWRPILVFDHLYIARQRRNMGLTARCAFQFRLVSDYLQCILILTEYLFLCLQCTWVIIFSDGIIPWQDFWAEVSMKLTVMPFLWSCCAGNPRGDVLLDTLRGCILYHLWSDVLYMIIILIGRLYGWDLWSLFLHLFLKGLSIRIGASWKTLGALCLCNWRFDSIGCSQYYQVLFQLFWCFFSLSQKRILSAAPVNSVHGRS